MWTKVKLLFAGEKKDNTPCKDEPLFEVEEEEEDTPPPPRRRSPGPCISGMSINSFAPLDDDFSLLCSGCIPGDIPLEPRAATNADYLDTERVLFKATEMCSYCGCERLTDSYNRCVNCGSSNFNHSC